MHSHPEDPHLHSRCPQRPDTAARSQGSKTFLDRPVGWVVGLDRWLLLGHLDPGFREKFVNLRIYINIE